MDKISKCNKCLPNEHIVIVRVNKEQKKHIKQKSKLLKTSMTTYIRSLINKDIPKNN